MIRNTNRQTGVPVVVSGDKKAVFPKRIQLTQKHFDEFWIQELLVKNPELLPIERLETVFAPSIPIGREVSTNVGSIDNLYISPQGYITIVETKLWRNPEARREVVGQIIDYAQDLSTWNYEKLNEAAKTFNQKYNKNNNGIIETVKQYTDLDASDENELIDTISRNLRKGRFLLLIAGDGIREEVEALTDFLNNSSQLQFTLALVELHVYQINEDNKEDLLIIPQVITRTREITRAVVAIDDSFSGKIKVDLNIAEKPREQIRLSLSEEEYFEKLGHHTNQQTIAFVKQLITDMEELGCIIEWKSASFVVKYTDPSGSGFNFTLFVVQQNGTIFPGWLGGQLKTHGLNEKIAFDFASKSAVIFDKQVSPKYPDSWLGIVTSEKLSQNYDSFKNLIFETIESIKRGGEET